MKYITGEHALNLPCSLETCGDWHTLSMNWNKIEFAETEGSVFGEYGIETCDVVPFHEGEIFYIANTLRALLDLLKSGRTVLCQGMKNDYICNDKYTKEFFEKVWQIQDVSGVNEIMEREWRLEWIDYRERRLDEKASGNNNDGIVTNI